MMLGKRKRAVMVPPPKKRKKNQSAIDEITFDFDARADYLTGFHKRKLQRIKHAQEQAAKLEREEKLAARKAMREERKADLEKHVEAINTLLRKAAAGNMSSDSGDDDDEDGWSGIKDAKAAPLDIEAEFEDEDRHTTVTIEAVDITKDGFKKPTEDDGEEDAVVHVAPEEAEKPQAEKRDENGKRIWTKERPNFPKKKKKKFRYESKAERKVTRYKERSKGRSQAKERKE